jgi:hypothetical protein
MVRFINARRGYATIPPFVASLKNAASASAKSAEASPESINSLVAFYKRLPKGLPTATETYGSGLIGNYRAKYSNTGAPLLHAGLLIFGVGYFVSYHCHLSK